MADPSGDDDANRHGRLRSIEADMTGCAVRGGGDSLSLSNREVADCAVDRAEIQREHK
jgi:hypothetical protein